MSNVGPSTVQSPTAELSDLNITLFVVIVVTIIELVGSFRPAVVFLRASFLWIRLICAIVAEQVRRDIMDLHAGSMVQHLQVLKYRLPDLVQVLPGVLIFNPCTDIRMKGEVWSEVFKVLCDGMRESYSTEAREPAHSALQRAELTPTMLGGTRP